MPLANLSERFYQKFGHDLVEELVSWLNEMDATYRTDLRELNELNFARFDAKLEQRIAEVKADLRQEIAGSRTELLAAIGAQGREMTTTAGDLRSEMADLRTELRTGMADLGKEMAAQRGVLINWIVGCGIGAVTVLGGLMFTLLRYFHP